jgi:hypothetical protein
VTDRPLADILAEAENPDYVRVATAKVLLRQDLVARHTELEVELAEAIARDSQSNDPDEAPPIAHQLAALEDEMEAARVEFRFRNIGKKAWADLLKDHPPTKEQLAADKRVDHNPAEFPIAAMAASCQSPKMDDAAVRRLEAALTDSQFTALWRACLEANLGGADVPKSLAAGRILQVNGRYASSVSAAAVLSAAASS